VNLNVKKSTASLFVEKKHKKNTNIFPYIMVIPTFIILAVVIIVPIMKAFQMSFSYHVLTDMLNYKPFIGLENYITMIKDASFWNSIWISTYYTVGTVIGSYSIGLIFALIFNKNFRGKSLLRSFALLPWAVPYVSSVLIWVWIYEAQSTGVLNWALLNLGIIDSPVAWLSNTNTVVPSLMAVNIWKEFPFAMIMILAGLQTIPKELYEAASADGASTWQKFWNITMPSLRFVNVVIILLLTIWTFKQFTIIYLMTGGGPGESSNALIIQTYNQAFKNLDMGYAATLGISSLIISLIFCFLFLKANKKGEGS
jgi:multiple sugar transport system permease protein